MKNDANTTIQELKDLVVQFSRERHWGKHHSGKNLSMTIAIEAAELMEHYQWERKGQPDKAEIAAELSDIIFNCLNFAATNDIDIATVFRRKHAHLVKKYPVELFNEHRDNEEDYKRIKKQYRSKKGKI
jgi:NTP pyrophosphatase (non-canonical NTP hydrolase)